MRHALFLIAACGGSTTEPPVAHVQALASPPESAADLQVATVNGRPVWGSCVARQGNVNDCIAFELLAQAAEAKGLAGDPSVVEATHTAMVNRLVEREFEDKVKTFADLDGAYDALVAKNLYRMHRPEYRSSAYARIMLPPNATPEADAKARATAQQIADAVRDQSGLFASHLFEIAKGIAPGPDLDVHTVDPLLPKGLETPYADALYGIPEIGRTAGPIRTNEGWDVVLWMGSIPKQDLTRDELLGELFPELRRHFFIDWVEKLRAAANIAVTVDYAQLEASGS